MDNLLIIKDLHAEIDGKEILKGINLEIKPARFTPLWDPMGLVKAH